MSEIQIRVVAIEHGSDHALVRVVVAVIVAGQAVHEEELVVNVGDTLSFPIDFALGGYYDD